MTHKTALFFMLFSRLRIIKTRLSQPQTLSNKPALAGWLLFIIKFLTGISAPVFVTLRCGECQKRTSALRQQFIEMFCYGFWVFDDINQVSSSHVGHDRVDLWSLRRQAVTNVWQESQDLLQDVCHRLSTVNFFIPWALVKMVCVTAEVWVQKLRCTDYLQEPYNTVPFKLALDDFV